MKILKNVLLFIYEPFLILANEINSDKVTKFFIHHKIMVYILAFLISLGIIIYIYNK